MYGMVWCGMVEDWMGTPMTLCMHGMRLPLSGFVCMFVGGQTVGERWRSWMLCEVAYDKVLCLLESWSLRLEHFDGWMFMIL